MQNTLEELKNSLESLNEEKTEKILNQSVKLFELLVRLDGVSTEKNIALAILPGNIKEIPSTKNLKAILVKPSVIIKNITAQIEKIESKNRLRKLL